MHYSNDTIVIGDGYFKIDSINRDIIKRIGQMDL